MRKHPRGGSPPAGTTDTRVCGGHTLSALAEKELDAPTLKWRESSGRNDSEKSLFEFLISATLNLRCPILAALLTEAHASLKSTFASSSHAERMRVKYLVSVKKMHCKNVPHPWGRCTTIKIRSLTPATLCFFITRYENMYRHTMCCPCVTLYCDILSACCYEDLFQELQEMSILGIVENVCTITHEAGRAPSDLHGEHESSPKT